MENIKLIELKKIQTNMPKSIISSSVDGFKYVRQFYGDDIEIFESFFLLMLDRKNETISYAKISQGGVSGTVVDIKILAKYAVESLCSSVILCHNHPSGKLVPSVEDIKITKKVKEALSLFDINVLDSLIISVDAYYSMADSGTL